MALRSSWDGFLKLSLISVPVRAYNAVVPGGGDIHFHQIHRECGNRIRYQKVCPVHGEVTKDEIVSGYEYEKGKYVEFDQSELSELRAEDEKAINIDAFTAPDTVEPLYLTGKTFFLVPTGPAGQKPYALLHEVMKEKNRHAVATIVLSGHDETVLIRPMDKLLTMTVLYYEDQVKHPSAFEDEVSAGKVNAQELKLAATLVDASTPEEFDFSQYKDRYNERVTQALEAKLGGKKPEAPRREKPPHVINLMDALRKSLERVPANGKEHRTHRAAAPVRHGRAHHRRKTA
jgi:DNA end-binding protein Ku